MKIDPLCRSLSVGASTSSRRFLNYVEANSIGHYIPHCRIFLFASSLVHSRQSLLDHPIVWGDLSPKIDERNEKMKNQPVAWISSQSSRRQQDSLKQQIINIKIGIPSLIVRAANRIDCACVAAICMIISAKYRLAKY